MSWVVQSLFEGLNRYLYPEISSHKDLVDPAPEVPPPPVDNQIILRKRFGENEDIHNFLNKYFSAYCNNYLPLDEPTLQKMWDVLERREIGRGIAHHWRELLGISKPCFESTHRDIPNLDLLKRALDAQLVFDRELLKLQKLDCYQNLARGRVEQELSFLKRLQGGGIPEGKAEEKFEKQLQEKAAHMGRSFETQLERSIKQREDLIAALEERVDKVDVRFELIKPKSQYIRAIGELSFGEVLKTQEIKVKGDSLHHSLQDHYIIAEGNPILDRDARFIILKIAHDVPESIRRELTCLQGTEGILEIARSALESKAPNEIVVLDYPGVKKGSIEICYENASESLLLHENRDVNMKTRRRKLRNGVYERSNRPENPTHFSKLMEFWREQAKDGWSEHRESTAGVDGHQGVLINRHMIDLVLSGKVDQLAQSACQNLGEYFAALENSDAGRLPGSYLEDSRFIQAQRLHTYMFEHLKTNHFEKRTIISPLKIGVEGSYSWPADKARVPLLIHDLFDSYTNWGRNLEQFLEEIRKPGHEKAAIAIGGERFLSQLDLFKDLLDSFVKECEVACRAKTTPEQADAVLGLSMLAISKKLPTLTQCMVQISVPFSSAAKQTEVDGAMGDLQDLYRKAIPPFWQNKAKLKLILGDLMKGTELSPLWQMMAETMEIADRELIKNEFLRSRFAKQLIGAK